MSLKQALDRKRKQDEQQLVHRPKKTRAADDPATLAENSASSQGGIAEDTGILTEETDTNLSDNDNNYLFSCPHCLENITEVLVEDPESNRLQGIPLGDKGV